LSLYFGPKALGDPPDPTVAFADPRPDWFARWWYAFLYFKPRGLESFAMVYLPLIVVVLLLVLPLVSNRGERSLTRRPWAIVVVAVTAIVMGTLTVMGMRAPWAPAYDTQPLGSAELGGAPPEVLAGAQVFYARGCQYCHAVLDRGGRYGPDLTETAARISPQEITVRIVQGHRRDMPGYLGILSDDDLAAILALLQALPALREQPGMR
jgi:ubiquinol-cytochrome c reductase cytochrome b subunit